jgi:hypothetical protein
MRLAHGNTPFHDDPAIWGILQMVGALGLTGTVSFLVYWFLNR